MVTKQELEKRIHSLCKALGENWDTVFIINKINQYYLCGTMQDGLLVIKKNGEIFYFARKSFERAKAECPFDNIYPMGSYKDAVKIIGADCGVTYLETETVTIGVMERLKKYFVIDEIKPVERIIMSVRSKKSDYELNCLRQAGALHNDFLVNVAPTLMKEGMSEVDLTGSLYDAMLKLGHHGVARFGMFQTEMICGQMGFGENSLYPTSFDGPGGMLGLNAAVPTMGNRDRILKKGDLVFLDFAFGIEGYHTDKSQIYMFGANPSDEVISIHRKCMEIQKKCASLLTVGNIPSEIYNNIMSGLDEIFLENFMGFGNRKVKFLGHGTGLQIDEIPVIANGFDEPLCENTTIALEPKKGVAGIGVVGVEDTYIVTKNGGDCITGGGRDIIVV